MTAEQKIKKTILLEALSLGDIDPLDPDSITTETVDELYSSSEIQDAAEAFRCSGVPSGIEGGDWSRHYESESVAAQVFDGSWVGFTYWHGGGKHGEPSAIDWMDKAYPLDMVEVMEPVKKFSRAVV